MKLYFACFITFICFASTSATACPNDEYQKRLSSIAFKDTSSITQAAEELIKIARNQPNKCREDLIFTFRMYYINCLNKYNNRIESLGINEANESNINKALSKVRAGLAKLDRCISEEVAL
jgi:hypothetical protein